MNRVIVQSMPALQALLIEDGSRRVIAQAHGTRDLEAIGRLVAQNPHLFGLEGVSAKFREIDELNE